MEVFSNVKAPAGELPGLSFEGSINLYKDQWGLREAHTPIFIII